jgi:hypothetical protein
MAGRRHVVTDRRAEHMVVLDQKHTHVPPFRKRPATLKHDPKKWMPVLRKRSCSTKELA